MELRSYQAEAVESAFRDWQAGARSTLFVCPTGGGKSLVYCKIAERARQWGRILIVADREWLVTYARDNIQTHTGLTAGIEMGDELVDRANLPDVVCCTIQSLHRRVTSTYRHSKFDPDAFGLVIFDEADLALAPSYLKVAAYFSKARIWGCTATPERADGVALSAVFERVSLDVDVRDLIDAGYISPVRQHAVRVLDLQRVRIDGDDFAEASLDKILREERHLHEVVTATLELAGDRPTLVFGSTVAHAQALAALFNRYRKGSATAVHGGMPRPDRRTEIERFRRREVQFLCNCALIMRGVDLPLVSCVAMARPTQSRTVYVQALGRGFRLSPETGKHDLLALDFTDAADSFSIINAVDVLGGRELPEVRERAREILDEKPGGDVTEAIEQAREDVQIEAVRERVLAKAKLRVREVEVREPIDWDNQPLGEIDDAELARRLGVTTGAVRGARVRRRIGRFRPGKEQYEKARSVDWSTQPLGKESDAAIAKALGLRVHDVTHARQRLGIPSRGPNAGPKKKLPPIDWDSIPLGKVSDAEAARLAGCSKAYAHDQRVARGIPSVRAQSVDPSEAP